MAMLFFAGTPSFAPNSKPVLAGLLHGFEGGIVIDPFNPGADEVGSGFMWGMGGDFSCYWLLIDAPFRDLKPTNPAIEMSAD